MVIWSVWHGLPGESGEDLSASRVAGASVADRPADVARLPTEAPTAVVLDGLAPPADDRGDDGAVASGSLVSSMPYAKVRMDSRVDRVSPKPDSQAGTEDRVDPATRRQFVRSWASLVVARHLPEQRRGELIRALADQAFGDRAETELARIEKSDAARREVERRERVLAWLREEFAALRAGESMAQADRQAAVRRLLDEYLDRL